MKAIIEKTYAGHDLIGYYVSIYDEDGYLLSCQLYNDLSAVIATLEDKGIVYDGITRQEYKF